MRAGGASRPEPAATVLVTGACFDSPWLRWLISAALESNSLA
ncbi:hypothetical protein BV133_680 [Blastochloris viridis]|uniref:Uncharacterized protein n=1 Tax=Blastochloris viridis TaxID=1079 RepID=A0A182CZ94_BLAVI|nr:hypothetical protein BV133_680 [Blastochloris viridis]